MITERTIINFLIIGATVFLAPFVIYSTLTIDYGPIVLLGGFCALVLGFFFLKDKLSIWPLLGTGIAGTLNFLPLPLQATHVFCILLICYFITGYIAIRQKSMKLGKTKFLWPILIVTLIVLYHNHSVGVHVLGGETEGGKPAVMLFLVVLAYFSGINVTTPSVSFLSKVPLYFVLLSFISNVPFFITTFFPHLAPYLYFISGNVDLDVYASTQGGTSVGEGSGIGRSIAFASVGSALQLYLFSRYPLTTWIRPERWWVAGLSLVCLGLAVESGYRNVLFTFVVVTMVATLCHYSVRALVLPLSLFLLALIFVTASNDNLIHLPVNRLPLIAQRSLSFFPGDWDNEALESAQESNDFRMNIQNVYIKEYLFKSPFFGNGFSIDTKEYDALNSGMLSATADANYLQAKLFITGKMFHTGWLSVYDAVGIVGTLAFVILGWNEIMLTGHFIFGAKANHQSVLFPFYVWIMCNLVSMMIGFFAVFGDFAQTFTYLCVYAIVLSHLSDLENPADVPVPLPDRQRQVEFTGLRGANYGYHSRS